MAQNEKTRKIPVRRCVGCGEHFPKNSLIRILRSPDGEISLDFNGKKSGRGAYVCNEPACVEKCVKKRIFDKVFGVRLSDDAYASIAEQYDSNKP